MRNLWYAPSVELYVMHVGMGGERSFVDLSREVSSCSVRLSENGAGTLEATLQDRHAAGPGLPYSKWAGRILPMDVICAYATAQHGRVRMFTGYVNSVPMERLYPGDFRITATDALYRLQRLYWDPVLAQMDGLLGYGDVSATFEGTIAGVMERAAGADPSSVYIQDVPQDMVQFAEDLWESEKGDREDAADRLRALQKVFSTAMPSSSGTGSASGVNGGQGASQGLGAGQSVDVPTDIQTATATYTIYTPSGWGYADGSTAAVAAGTAQESVHSAWVSGGCSYDTHGVALLGGRYLVALSPKFGSCGDMVDVSYDNGVTLQCTIGDEKGADAQSEWGHVYGGLVAVVEFEISMDSYREHSAYGSLAVDAWWPELVGAKVSRVTNYGPAL